MRGRICPAPHFEWRIKAQAANGSGLFGIPIQTPLLYSEVKILLYFVKFILFVNKFAAFYRP